MDNHGQIIVRHEHSVHLQSDGFLLVQTETMSWNIQQCAPSVCVHFVPMKGKKMIFGPICLHLTKPSLHVANLPTAQDVF